MDTNIDTNMDENEYDLIICVYGCDTIPKYNEQIRVINDTWGKLCNTCKYNVKLLYFLGEKTNDDSYIGENYIHLPGVLDDYSSASHKQYQGLKYIHEKFKYKFVFCCGTDTYLNIPKMSELTNYFEHNVNYLIGGDIGWRVINSSRYLFFFGGAGFMLTNKCLSLLYPLLPNILDKWTEICIQNKKEFEPNDKCYNTPIHLIIGKEHTDSSDVSISYFLQQPEINTKLIHLPKLFYYCNYKGSTYDPNIPIYPMKPVYIENIVTCHLMTTQDCYDFTQLLINNSYFMDIPLFSSPDISEIMKNNELKYFYKNPIDGNDCCYE
jgi:hypothetical protein